MLTATLPLRLSPRALVTFSNRKPLRWSCCRPRNCQRTSGISSVSLLIGTVMRVSLSRFWRFSKCVRRSCRFGLVCTLASIDRYPCLFGSLAQRWQCFQFLFVGFRHARGNAVRRDFPFKQVAHQLRFVGVIDLRAAEPAADPGIGHALGIADRNIAESEIARGRRAGVE